MAGTFDIEFEDIQGFVVRGFGHLRQAGYAVFTITDPQRFRAWMNDRLRALDFIPASSRRKVPGPCNALGFTAAGLQKLAGTHLEMGSLPPEFLEGMVEEHRSRLLGDIDENRPEDWRWGGGSPGAIDGVLMVRCI